MIQFYCSIYQYFWVPSNSEYDVALQGTCINCDQNEEVCTSKKKCNGFWDSNTSVCLQKCNQSISQCNASCGGYWDSTLLKCDVCSKTQAECNSVGCNRQWVVNQCFNCKLNSANCVTVACSGIWKAATSSCLVCNENSTNCKQCGGFWKNTQCLQCDKNQITCSSCGGTYEADTSKCILINDEYTCLNQMKSIYKQPYWNGIKCVDCDEGQYVCNKECFRVWINQSCSTTSCDLDQYTCESLCFHKWNYSQQKCYNVDVDQPNVCTVENDAVMNNGSCIQCHASQDLCEVQCNQSYTPNGSRVWTNNKCTNCQADSNTCTNICKMDWITVSDGTTTVGTCIKCNMDSYNCAMCQGKWDINLLTCTSLQSFCNTDLATCNNQCAFIPTSEFKYQNSKCYYCNLNQFACENICGSLWLPKLQYCELLTTQDTCQLNNRGVWDSTNKKCNLCNSNKASCLLCKPDNTWVQEQGVCLNINLGKEYCDVKGESYVWVTDAMSAAYNIALDNGRCISCNQDSNVCKNACIRAWDSVNSLCLLCSNSKTVCETNCGKDWIPIDATTGICVKCSQSATICNTQCTDWYWDALSSTCINCNLSQTNCENPSQCNGSWDGTKCQFCNKSINNCEQKCFFVYSQQLSSCVNCQQSQLACEQQCGYIWDPTLASNKCILCNKSKVICEATGTYKCNGFWLATNKCTQFKCNQDQATCETKCLMKWNSKVSKCQKCTQTQYVDSGTGNCLECSTLLTSVSCSSNCAATQFFWDPTATTKCRECTPNEYWDGTQCKLCTTIHAKCSKCLKVSGVATCLGCSDNFRVQSATVCSCDNDRMPDLSNVCQLCSTLISNCVNCSVYGICSTCQQGYSWDSVKKTCRAKFSFTSSTQLGIAFVTDFTITLSYPNANNPSKTPIVYDVYLYNTIDDYNAELNDFLLQKITKGVLFQSKLAENSKYTLKLKSGKPVLAPLLVLDGQVIPPEDQILQFTVKKQYTFIDQFTKYINSVMGILEPKDFYYKMYTDELINQYYQNTCSNCPQGAACIANTKQCNCDALANGKTLYDCSGLDKTQFDKVVTELFGYFKENAATQPQSLQKVKDLLNHVNTVGNDNMNIDLFQYYAGLNPTVVAEKTNPTPADYLNYQDIIKKVVSYTDYIMDKKSAKTAQQIYVPHDNIQQNILQVLDVKSSYTLETLTNARLSAGSFGSISSLVTKLDIKQLQNSKNGNEPKIYGSASDLVIGGSFKASRFFYATDPFFIGNSTFTKYKNYPYVEYFVYSKTGASYSRQSVDFTFIFTVTDIKQSIKCAQREGDFLQLCSKTEIDSKNLQITCTCTNSGTLIEKTILVEPEVAKVEEDDTTMYIILGCALGGALIIFLGFTFVYLKKQKENDRYKILKKQKDGSRAIDPNLSLSDYELDVKD